MGLLGRLLDLLASGRGSDERGTAGPSSSRGSGSHDSGPPDGSDQPEPPNGSVTDLLDRVERASGSVPADLLGDLVDAVREDPAAFGGHLDRLLEALHGCDGATSVAAAVTLGTLAEHRPSLLADRVDDLVAGLDHENGYAREHVVDALANLVSASSPPVAALVERLVTEDGTLRREVAVVLGVVATTEGIDLPVERLESLGTGGNEPVRTAVRYLLGLHASERPDAEVPIDEGFEDHLAFVAAVRETDLDPWLERELVHDALRELVDREFPGADCRAVTVTRRPTGTEVRVYADHPVLVAERELRRAVEPVLGLDGFDVEVLPSAESAEGSVASGDDRGGRQQRR